MSYDPYQQQQQQKSQNFQQRPTDKSIQEERRMSDKSKRGSLRAPLEENRQSFDNMQPVSHPSGHVDTGKEQVR